MNGTGTGQGERDWDQWVLTYCAEMFTLVRDRERNQDPLFTIVLFQFPVAVPIPLPCSVSCLTFVTFSSKFEQRS